MAGSVSLLDFWVTAFKQASVITDTGMQLRASITLTTKRKPTMTDNEDAQAEKIFELQQEIIRLRGQITYLQEELASAEDTLYNTTGQLEDKIIQLEQYLGSNLPKA
jgi:uncharacterized protein YlxW (UPF0749 family)